MSASLSFAIDVFAVFGGRLSVSGWVTDVLPIASVELRSSGLPGGRQALASYGTIDSPDVAAQRGPTGARARFSEVFSFAADTQSLADVHLAVVYASGETAGVGNLVGAQPNPASALQARFAELLHQMPKGELLEVGSRARSGIVRRDMAPEGWGYTGFDVMAGPNVDMVGDVHEIAETFAAGQFQAVTAFSVLEHLLMPWKAVIELNAVMSVGAIGLFTTHQCWPLHDEPWDFWRFSDRAWPALLNKKTGFEIIEAAMGEPAFIVAQRCHSATNFGLQQHGALASNVLFRKIGPTRLRWPVTVGDTIDTSYPAGNIPG